MESSLLEPIFLESKRKPSDSAGEGAALWSGIAGTLDNINIGVTLRNVTTKFVWSTNEIFGLDRS
jgi:hypothetical protein